MVEGASTRCAQYALHAAVHPDIGEPSSYNQAIQSTEAGYWMDAMKEKFDFNQIRELGPHKSTTRKIDHQMSLGLQTQTWFL
jgi:hypothetical protein